MDSKNRRRWDAAVAIMAGLYANPNYSNFSDSTLASLAAGAVKSLEKIMMEEENQQKKAKELSK